MAEEVVDPSTAANSLKEAGNAFLASHQFQLAADKYTEAIDTFPTAIFYSNRAQALIKLEAYGMAIEDAEDALALDPTYVKAYYRRASAYYALGKLKEAIKDFKSVLKVVKNDPDATKKLKACEKAQREKEFQAALEVDARESRASVDYESIAVESSYIGPRLEGEISIDFVKEIIAHFRAQKSLHRKYVLRILVEAREMFHRLPSLIRIALPAPPPSDSTLSSQGPEEPESLSPSGHINVCGDTHGQFYDLLNIFEIGGFPSETNPYLFNGDFVDRGSFSFETVTTLIAIKLACPSALNMLRGNHETKNMNKIYGFEGEVLHKYDIGVMNLFTEVFNLLPLAAVIAEKVFVVHGGLSTQNDGVVTLKEIESIPRDREPPESGLMSDLLWADPQFMPGRALSKRGLGFSFGPDITERFLSTNNLELLVRSHEVKHEGYVVEHKGKCITVFSAPNYCDQMGNKGAFIRFEEDCRPNFVQFDAVPHPNIPPMRYAGNMFGL